MGHEHDGTYSGARRAATLFHQDADNAAQSMHNIARAEENGTISEERANQLAANIMNATRPVPIYKPRPRRPYSSKPTRTEPVKNEPGAPRVNNQCTRSGCRNPRRQCAWPFSVLCFDVYSPGLAKAYPNTVKPDEKCPTQGSGPLGWIINQIRNAQLAAAPYRSGVPDPIQLAAQLARAGLAAMSGQTGQVAPVQQSAPAPPISCSAGKTVYKERTWPGGWFCADPVADSVRIQLTHAVPYAEAVELGLI